MFNIMGAESTCQALYYIHAENNDCILLRQDNFYGGICPHCPHGSAASGYSATSIAVGWLELTAGRSLVARANCGLSNHVKRTRAGAELIVVL